MDTKISQQYGDEINSCRLRTARQKERMRYVDFDKALIQLYREERELWNQKNNLGWEPLTPPVQKGWKRFYVVRDDVARNKHALFFENILQKINTYDWSSKKDFLVKKRKRGRKIYVVKHQNLAMPNTWHFNRMNFNDDEKQFFHVEQYNGKWKKEPCFRYVFSEPWRFVLRVKPNIIDKIRKKDSLIESRLQEIDAYMVRNDYRKRLWKILGKNSRNGWKKYEVKDKEKDIFRNKSQAQILDMINV